MGLFSKKECSICGGEIGLLGNRKLADGNCCKDCAKLLSPYLADRRGSTVEEIKAHLAYRRANEAVLADFHPTKIFGSGVKLYLDEGIGKFIVTGYSDWQRHNPDLITLDQVIDVRTDVRESRIEEYKQTPDGKHVSFNPPRYRYSYSFHVYLSLDTPWFNEISFALNGPEPHSRHEPLYRDYEEQAEAIRRALTGVAPKPDAASILKTVAETIAQVAVKPAANGWTCACGSVNTGNFCTNCGAKKPEKKAFKCDKCGWVPEDPSNPPKFCPNCGDPFNEDDRV